MWNYTGILGAAGVIGVCIGIYFGLKWWKGRKERDPLRALANVDANCPRIFQAWLGVTATMQPSVFMRGRATSAMMGEEVQIAKHDLMWHAKESFGIYNEGMVGQFNGAPLNQRLEEWTIGQGTAMRRRLKDLNPNIQLFVGAGFREGQDGYTDFPPDHAWWKRDAAGNRVRSGWMDSYLFNLDLPEVRQHWADGVQRLFETGVWDGVMLDNVKDEPNVADIIKRIRAHQRNMPLIVNCNYRICPNVCPLVDGIFMECGPLDAKGWARVIEALDYNERHVRQPALNCLEVSGGRSNERQMMALTCLSLTSSNGYCLYADPGPGYASTHAHAWHDVWSRKLGKPVSSTAFDGTRRIRKFEGGLVQFDIPPKNSLITLG